MTWQSEFNDLQKKEHSLCELLIIRSLIDLTEYDTESEKWKGFVTKKRDQFEVGLDFIAAKVGYYAWKQVFYSEEFSSKFKEDQEISKIFHRFVYYKRGWNMIPKSTDFFSKSNVSLREKIIKNCLTVDVLKKTKNDCQIFRISNNGKYLIVENNVIDYFDPINLVDSIIFRHFPDDLRSFTTTKKRINKKIRGKTYDEIKKIQKNVCFYCEEKPIEVQEHLIPETLLHETNVSNIVGACKKCNNKKWFKKPPEKEHFDKILKRNRDPSVLIEDSYSEEDYVKKYKRFKKIVEQKINCT
jgi:hypothetical protein